MKTSKKEDAFNHDHTDHLLAGLRKPTERKPSNSTPTATTATSIMRLPNSQKFSPPTKFSQIHKKEPGMTPTANQSYAVTVEGRKITTNTMCASQVLKIS